LKRKKDIHRSPDRRRQGQEVKKQKQEIRGKKQEKEIRDIRYWPFFLPRKPTSEFTIRNPVNIRIPY